MYLYMEIRVLQSSAQRPGCNSAIKDTTTLFFFQIFDISLSIVRGGLWG